MGWFEWDVWDVWDVWDGMDGTYGMGWMGWMGCGGLSGMFCIRLPPCLTPLPVFCRWVPIVLVEGMDDWVVDRPGMRQSFIRLSSR